MKTKKLESLKTNKFATLEKKEMKSILGGAACTGNTVTFTDCGCVSNDGDDSFKGECGGVA